MTLGELTKHLLAYLNPLDVRPSFREEKPGTLHLTLGAPLPERAYDELHRLAWNLGVKDIQTDPDDEKKWSLTL